MRLRGTWFLTLVLVALAVSATAHAERLGRHQARRDAGGRLLPWTSWREAMTREVNWYLAAPRDHGYPVFVTMTFMTGDYRPDSTRDDFIPATQDGMGIVSYLAWDAFTGHRDPRVLATARAMGDFLVNECATPDSGAWPRFTRSTGRRGQFPIPPDGGSQGDGAYEVQPDKGALAGDALVRLWRATGERRYLEQALRNARTLRAHQAPGDATHSPWPYRVDWRSGEPRGDVASDMVAPLRLYDGLIAAGHGEFAGARDSLWAWIRDRQIPSASGDAALWVQFFEDHHGTDNRNAWSPLATARYLIARRDTLDPRWAEHARALIEFVNQRFVSLRHGVAVCGEQDYDHNPWGGIQSSYGAVLALYGASIGTDEYRRAAREALDFALYATGDDGCPCEQAQYDCRGGWQEDAHTDKLHNFVDAMRAVPAWADEGAPLRRAKRSSR